MRTLVVTSCTGKKAVERRDQLTLEDFRDPDRLAKREQDLAGSMRPAISMYTGLQHLRLTEGVRQWRETFGRQSLDLVVVSAGYGLIDENRLIAPYEVTFSAMKSREIVAWAHQRGIPSTIRQVVKGYQLVIFLLGDKYLRALDPPVMPSLSQRFVFLSSAGDERTFGTFGVTVVPAAREEAAKYSEGIVALKGKMFLLFARGMVKRGQAGWDAIIQDDSRISFAAIMDAAL